jgi:hypothetical protein
MELVENLLGLLAKNGDEFRLERRTLSKYSLLPRMRWRTA